MQNCCVNEPRGPTVSRQLVNRIRQASSGFLFLINQEPYQLSGRSRPRCTSWGILWGSSTVMLLERS